MDLGLLFSILRFPPLIRSLLFFLICKSEVSLAHLGSQLVFSLIDFGLPLTQGFVDLYLFLLPLQGTFFLLLLSL